MLAGRRRVVKFCKYKTEEKLCRYVCHIDVPKGIVGLSHPQPLPSYSVRASKAIPVSGLDIRRVPVWDIFKNFYGLTDKFLCSVLFSRFTEWQVAKLCTYLCTRLTSTGNHCGNYLTSSDFIVMKGNKKISRVFFGDVNRHRLLNELVFLSRYLLWKAMLLSLFQRWFPFKMQAGSLT